VIPWVARKTTVLGRPAEATLRSVIAAAGHVSGQKTKVAVTPA